MGLHGSSTTAVILQDVKVPGGNLLGEVGKGHHIAFNILNVGRYKLGNAAVGGGRMALNNGIRYAIDRKAFGKSISEFGLIQEVIQGLRTVRAEMKLDPKKKVAAEFASGEAKTRVVIEANREAVQRLGSLSGLSVVAGKLPEGGGGMRSTAEFDLRIPYAEETIDVAAELARLKKEIEGLQKAIASKEKQLGNETFRSRAPENIIKQMEEALAEQKIELEKLLKRKAQLEG